MPYLDIHSYGIIGDMHSCALVGLNGSIDWACFPQFDSPSCFAAILDDAKGGRFLIAPEGEHSVQQRYLGDTNVLETTFSTATGVVTVVDFMSIRRPSEEAPPHQIHRLVRGQSGHVEMRVEFQPRLDYARGDTKFQFEANGVLASLGDSRLALSSPVALNPETSGDGGEKASAVFTVRAGDTHPFVVAYGADRPSSLRSLDSESRLRQAMLYWESSVGKMHYNGLWRDEVVRSFLALHLLMYEPTGAVIAAPTTSLPERIGGERNWDYRFT
ncbi:MAG: trehalase-like domain-containing protein, partial [Dehalococcoidia bacterium]